MLTKTRGIVVRTVKYGESSAICNILTEHFGLLGFHAAGAYKPKSKISASYLQPLTELEISFNYKKTGGLLKISDIRCIAYSDPARMNQMAMYHICCELLQQTIKENELNPALFRYLTEEAIPGLNTKLHFWQLPFLMLNILHHYGCSPNCETYKDGAGLDLQNGVFTTLLQSRHQIAGIDSAFAIYRMLTRGINELNHDNTLRQTVIEDLIKYFRYHIREDFELRSIEVYGEMSRSL